MSFDSYLIYPGVTLGESALIDPFVIIGYPLADGSELPTMIGANAHIRSHSVIYTGNRIGINFQTGHGVLVRESNQIGDKVSIGSHTVIEHHVIIKSGVRIHSQAFIPEFTILEEYCWVGPGVSLTNARYPRSSNVKGSLHGPTIGSRAKIGAGAVILPGVHVGRNSLIGAGAVVVGDVPENSVVVGNPAHVIKMIDQISDYMSQE